MAKLGSKKRPAIVRVQGEDRAAEIMSICEQHGWQVIIGIEPDKPEDTSHVDRLLNPTAPVKSIKNEPKLGRNDPCSCGSGLKYKKCCGK